MKDLFDNERQIYDNALKHLHEIQKGAPCNGNEFKTLVKEYGKLLHLLRMVTKISDRTTGLLNTSNLALLKKVHYDALTGIYSRRFMEENLKRIIKSLSRSGSTLSILMADIDYFKSYNDTYGHSEGDECLKLIANALNGSILREEDFVARYGGEEFVVVLPNTGEKSACIMANKLLASVRTCNIPHEKSKVAGCVTISIGVTTGEVKHSQSGADYIKLADKALYISKKNGRNRYTFINFKEHAE